MTPFDLVDWPCPAPGGGTRDELALVFDKGREHRLLVLPAWFDEANKLRRLTVEVMRRLDLSGIDCIVPDLPGCNESTAKLADQTLAGWREAAEAAAVHFAATHVLTVRAGALLAPDGLPGWRYAPISGRQVLRGMLRARMIAAREAGRSERTDDLQAFAREEGIELAGWSIGAEMFRDLEVAEPGTHLVEVEQAALGGPALWLRAEPGEDPEQADALAAVLAIGMTGDMSRLQLTFNCEGTTLAGTLDTAPSTSGLLIVSGGNEVRSGAFSGQAALAARIARKGFPVFRFDRRGVGDSGGENRGFRKSRKDIEAAVAAFRAIAPNVDRVVGFGNCDAASALMLAEGTGFDALVLSNPWTIEVSNAAPPPAAVRARYAGKLKDPREVLRLLSGGVNLGKLARGVVQAARPGAAPSSLAGEISAGLSAFDGPARIVLASADRTAQAFEANWPQVDPRVAHCAGATHAWVEPHARDFLEGELLAMLRA